MRCSDQWIYFFLSSYKIKLMQKFRQEPEKKHLLICILKSYDDMGHLVYNKNFKNNTRRIRNFDEISQKMSDFWHENVQKLVETYYVEVPPHTFRHHRLLNKNKETLEKNFHFGSVVVKAIITFK